MPQRIAKLQATIEELQTELASLETVDDETRAVLENAVDEIQAALHKEEHTELGESTLITKLRDSAEKFEASHPTLFGIVSRTIDALGQMGI
jgi:septal ring factor EnvC (AmiA/AmiB activator)